MHSKEREATPTDGAAKGACAQRGALVLEAVDSAPELGRLSCGGLQLVALGSKRLQLRACACELGDWTGEGRTRGNNNSNDPSRSARLRKVSRPT